MNSLTVKVFRIRLLDPFYTFANVTEVSDKGLREPRFILNILFLLLFKIFTAMQKHQGDKFLRRVLLKIMQHSNEAACNCYAPYIWLTNNSSS